MPEIATRHGGLLAEVADVDTLLHVCEALRDAGYQRFDAYTPYPVHGIDEAIGIVPTRIPWAVLGAGLVGAGTAIGMQWWMNAVDYPFRISGKPVFSLPANIPVAFEMTVLFAAVTAFIVTLALCKLPQLHRSLFERPRFMRASDDGLFVAVEAGDPKYDRDDVEALLRDAGAEAVEAFEATTTAPIPGRLKLVGAIVAAATLLPIAVALRARTRTSSKPRIHLFSDMDQQPKLKAQAPHAAFSDGRAARRPVAGTVAAGASNLDDHLHRGVVEGAWASTLPPSIPVDRATLERGRQRFDIYCAPCHGAAGYGDGMVALRAEAIGATKWVQPTSMHEDHVKAQPVGQLFHVVTHGVRNMAGYGHAIPPRDRWAIVAYLRTLQFSQSASRDDVPASVALDPR